MPPWLRRAGDVCLGFTAASIPLSTGGMQMGMVALGGLTLVATARGHRVMRSTPLDDVLVLFFGTLAITTLASGDLLPAVGWRRPWVVLAYFVVFWWLRDGAHAVRLTRIIVGAATLAAAYGIVQHWTGADWYRSLAGRPIRVRPPAPGASGYAVIGFFANYLTFAHTMLFPLAWAAALALRRTALGLVGAPAILVAILFSTARGAWLAALAILAALALMVRTRQVALGLAGLGALAGAAFTIAPELRHRAMHMFSLGEVNAGRVGIYQANLDIIHEHPWLGLGFGHYAHAARPYYAARPAADRRSHAHSNYLHMAAEAGLIGLAAFTLLYAVALVRGWPAVARAPDGRSWAAAAGAWAGMVGFLVGGVTQYTFGDNEVALTMWVTLAILMRLGEETPEGMA